MPAIAVGQKAPDFTLPSNVDENVSLHDILEKKTAVVAFYVLDFTST